MHGTARVWYEITWYFFRRAAKEAADVCPVMSLKISLRLSGPAFSIWIVPQIGQRKGKKGRRKGWIEWSKGKTNERKKNEWINEKERTKEWDTEREKEREKLKETNKYNIKKVREEN